MSPLRLFTVVVLVFGQMAALVGCKAEPPSSGPADSLPNPSPYLSSTPPWAMPRAMSEQNKISFMRSQLDSIAAQEPGADVLGVFYMRRPITISEYEALRSIYALQNGPLAAVHIGIGDAAISAQLLDQFGVLLPSGETLRAHAVAWGVDRGYARPNEPVQIDVVSLAVYATAPQLKRLWADHEEIIRALGVAGRRGDANMVGWLPINPWDPMP